MFGLLCLYVSQLGLYLSSALVCNLLARWLSSQKKVALLEGHPVTILTGSTWTNTRTYGYLPNLVERHHSDGALRSVDFEVEILSVGACQPEDACQPTYIVGSFKPLG